jgi:hypothetical protein
MLEASLKRFGHLSQDKYPEVVLTEDLTRLAKLLWEEE